MRLRIALTPGDPAGIGPEITASLLSEERIEGVDFVVVGSASAVIGALPAESGGKFDIVPPENMSEICESCSYPVIVDTGGGLKVPVGRPSEAGGRISGASVEAAVTMVKSGLADGIVTGPISKEALNMAGYRYSGHTEMLADLSDSPDCQMMMVNGKLRIVILTRDISLSQVPGAITSERLSRGIEITHRALKELWDIQTPLIAVAALNPHAGDGGVTGREEEDVIKPELQRMRRDGYNIEGPIPADTLFYEWKQKGYDAYLALYHDQGMIPFKIGGFGEGVNMTIGLPFVRTSVCHGTAFDIVGSGKASVASLEAAVSLALKCIITRRKQRNPGKY